ncbi:hypothetical protein H0A43_09455 [Arcobacter lanthieri]|uniref:hypothetical protein n=1 Tax=Aliarcobacter lanthieri TaxID=1355374 RepID=UPI0019214785|nr:hypothetical protein [Aliarcobacter lanthieri]MBL3520698.1 hypothetical protein [Aliarcobacter lanthieri]
MKKFIFFTLSFILLLTGFSVKFINEFDIFKDELLTKYELETKTTSLYLQENIKKYLEDKDIQILNKINSIFNNNFSSIQIEKGNFTITEKELIDLTNNLDKNLAWELTNLQIDENLGKILQTTQSDDLQKELLTIEGSIPNELNKNLVPSSDIYTFIPNKNFRNTSSLDIRFDATNQFDETINSSATLSFDKNIINFSNQNEQIAPKWFKDLIPIYIEEQSNNISNGFTSNATIYMNTNLEKLYFELYEKAKKEFFLNLLWFCVAFLGLLGLWFLYRFLVK